MKKLLIIIFFIISYSSLGQSYISFPDSGAVWKETYWWQPSPFFYNGIGDTYIEGDTVINDTIYKKIYNLRRDVYCSSIIISESEYTGALREDTINNKAYYRASDFLGEKLLYDYNLDVGDTLPADMNWFSYYSGVYVTDVDTILTSDSISRRIWFLDFEHPFEGWPQIIEGIGSTSGLLGGIEPYWEGWNELLCFSIDGNDVWYSHRETCFVITDSCTTVGLNEKILQINHTVYPNPFSQSTLLKYDYLNSENYQLKIINVTGQVIMEIKDINTGELIIPGNQLKSGIHFYRLTKNEKVVASGKLIKN